MDNWTEGKKPIIVLAPMADMTDGPFCRICREVSGNDFLIFREMVSAEALVRENKKTLRMCEFTPGERPLVAQIFGAKPEVIRRAARLVVDKCQPDGIDINMGCPVPKIAGKNCAGSALLKDPERAMEIIRQLRAENLGVPISVKTRLGWSNAKQILEFAPKLEAAGAQAITIHGRTKEQGYAGKANWEIIGEVKKILSIPVIANGDIATRDDIKKCLEITGADGVMIGRGALGNPWIFRSVIPSFPRRGRPARSAEQSEAGGGGLPEHALGSATSATPLRAEPLGGASALPLGKGEMTAGELIEVVLRHAKYHLQHYGEKSMPTFRKHLAWYFRGDRFGESRVSADGTRHDFAKSKKLRVQLVRISSLAELEEVLKKI